MSSNEQPGELAQGKHGINDADGLESAPMQNAHASSYKNGQPCCPFELAYCSGKNYILQCSTAIGVAVLLPFLGVSSLNLGRSQERPFS